jgi:DNA-binding IclR family transcriptional regulator
MSVTAKVFNYIARHPGSHVITIARGCKMTYKRTRSALDTLQAMGFVEWAGRNFAPAFSVSSDLHFNDIIANGFQVKIK